ncbi:MULTISPECIES: response regulator [unclassified Siphonobacter]|uniref:response regulator n=1 Tax=unclassified Siphonobacter TaxID=2635712 RepID=UPI000CA8BDD9|nr:MULTISPECIES: response regulator [unclassified Siphonobacter]MDQ1090353.1 CheY-like chemotaxis protein [Siphonobacter sp. SORGH_AS_1065]PKK37157.1 hypothetical protein BWI96_07320 [Siphonobacter sp. SORGH_AS_0500]
MSSSFVILVVEDDDDDRLLLETAMHKSKLNCQLAFARDGENALDMLETMETPPALIITDLNMPFMDGMEFVRELKNSSSWSKIPVIMLSTTTTESTIRQAYDNGVSSFISKPPTFEGLQQVWQQLYKSWVMPTQGS